MSWSTLERMRFKQHKTGKILVASGLTLALAAAMIGFYDAAVWFATGTWADTSLHGLLGPLPPLEPGELRSLELGLWVQPVWLLLALGGAILAMFGSALMDD
jgi:hypothetical protein